MEAAIGSILVVTLIFGVIEFGLAFKDYLSMSAAVRDGARVASTLGSTTSTDYDVIQQIKRRMVAVDSNQIERIVVFKASSPSSTIESVNAACKTTSITNVCNSYSAADLSRPSTDFVGSGSAKDVAWPPASREDTLSGPPDYVGVWVQISHQNITGLINVAETYSDEVVMRIEPATIS
ncbi:MAG: pilus assembly protein [Microthrixaceae bacterium]|nr:pilus assembly protein [Microthrixaceae bacterium]